MNENPLEYKFSDIDVGMKKKFSIRITESIIKNFAELSGDFNPLHVDENYATLTPFKQRVCHGMLLAAFFSRLVGMYLPGKNALYFSQTLNFEFPCFINDEISIEGEIIDKSIATKSITIKTIVYNKSGKRLVDGLAKVIVRE